MKLFSTLRSVRQAEREHFPLVKSMIDFDIIIEVGFAEEAGQPLTLKQLFLLNLSSRTTVRRCLSRLHQEGILLRCKDEGDRRSVRLVIPPPTLERFTRYGAMVAGLWQQMAQAERATKAR